MPSPRAALVAGLLMLAAAPAEAQHLQPLPEEAIPGFFDTSWLSPSTVESGSLVVYARELGPNRPRAVRIAATGGVADEPPLDAAGVASCGGGRWLLTVRTPRDGRSATYELRSPAGRIVWSRRFVMMALPSISLGCAGPTPLLGWVDDGELVLREAATATLGPERRIRIAPSGSRGVTVWTAHSAAELFVASNMIVPRGSTELLRIAGATITHRRSLGRATDVRLALAQRLLAAFHDDHGAAIVTSFALADLAPGAPATIAPREPHRSASVASLWPGPNGVVALSVHEGWEGPDFVAIPQGPNDPDRYEPAYHTAAYLQTWSPAAGPLASSRLGPATDFGADAIGPGAWLGSTLVVVEPLRRDRSYPNEPRFYPARVRRFRL